MWSAFALGILPTERAEWMTDTTIQERRKEGKKRPDRAGTALGLFSSCVYFLCRFFPVRPPFSFVFYIWGTECSREKGCLGIYEGKTIWDKNRFIQLGIPASKCFLQCVTTFFHLILSLYCESCSSPLPNNFQCTRALNAFSCGREEKNLHRQS